MTKIFVFEYLTGGGIDPAHAGAASLADLSALIVEGRVMRDALVSDLRELDGVQVSFASSRFETVAPTLVHCRAEQGESMTAFVARVAREHDYAWIIAPECDGLLLRLYDAVGAARWLGCAKEAIRVTSSKSATAACLAAHGIATTPAIEPGQADEPRAGRWVVKPDDGAGGLDTFVFDNFAAACAEYEARAAAARNPVLQAWVEGEPLSLSLICGAKGAQLVSINRQQISLSAGDEELELEEQPGRQLGQQPERQSEPQSEPQSGQQSGQQSEPQSKQQSGQQSEPQSKQQSGQQPRIVEFDGVTVNQIDLAGDQGRTLGALAQRVAKALPGLRGFVGIDVVWHPLHGPVVIEVNPRLTVAYAGLSAAPGGNLARTLLAAHGVHIERCNPAARSHDASCGCGVRP